MAKKTKGGRGGLHLSKESKNFQTATVQEALLRAYGPMDANFKALSGFVNNLTLRFETVVYGLEKKGLLTNEEFGAAFTEFTAFRSELQRLTTTLSGVDRIEAVLAWNAKEGVRKIKPVEAMLHEILGDPASKMTPEQRVSYAEKVGFGEGFVKAIGKHFMPAAEVPQESSVETPTESATETSTAPEPVVVETNVVPFPQPILPEESST